MHFIYSVDKFLLTHAYKTKERKAGMSCFFKRIFMMCCLGMLISSFSRQCVLKLKEYSDKKNAATRRHRTKSASARTKSFHDEENPPTGSYAETPLVSPISSIDKQRNSTSPDNDTSTEIVEDHSLIGRLLNCKPCRRVTDHQDRKNVSQSIWSRILTIELSMNNITNKFCSDN